MLFVLPPAKGDESHFLSGVSSYFTLLTEV